MIITHEVIEKAMSYPAYVELASQLIAQKQTTGTYNSEYWLEKTTQNISLIESLLQSVDIDGKINQILQAHQVPLIWLSITESWCIDSANILPVIYKMSEITPHINMKVLLRDSSFIIDSFTTQGSRSIPKVVCLDAESLVVLGVWGPRPLELQAKVMLDIRQINNSQDNKNEERHEDIIIKMSSWYKKDKTKSIQQEVFENLLIY